jgi:hypothetical protein
MRPNPVSLQKQNRPQKKQMFFVFSRVEFKLASKAGGRREDKP